MRSKSLQRLGHLLAYPSYFLTCISPEGSQCLWLSPPVLPALSAFSFYSSNWFRYE
jgi:hypothetical protein